MAKTYKYIHNVSYMANNNTFGVMVIHSDWSEIQTKSRIDEITQEILKGNPTLVNPIITNIITFKNK